MGFDFLLVQPQAFIEKKKPRLRRYTWQAMPAYAIKVKTVIVIDNVLDTISALQGNLTGTVSTVEKGVYTFENEWFYLFCRLTITLSSSTNTRLFNDYNGTGNRNPHKTHKTPPQNCSAAGFTYALKQPKSLISSGFRA